uniref:N(omega)-hydroxy-L-arginine amidinohydrolase n=1 Tax=Streptomyces lavendulae TaxID=1914 RepID=UPI002016A6F1|nr:Chain A, N(omega)-hydroxy-L-arginine amidinohydrolase [Streptomyces lavendulae]7EUQ_B Chain B, N(omega)-hydroxy-L-arginine amidinohydrolase [Streptomyces lavendulae]
MIDLIVSQGRVADRAAWMIEGAARTARALEERYGLKGHYVGEPAPHADDDWSVALPQARETLVAVREAATESIKGDNLTVLVNNTHSVSLATLPVVAREHPDAVVLYIDGHGDFNTPETTDTGNLHGMVLSGACGLWDSGHGAGLRPEQAVLVGSRDIDEGERELIRKAGVRVIPPGEATAQAVLDAVKDAPVWISIDWDVLEPGSIPADYTVPDGMLPAQIRAVFEAIPAERLIGVELAELNAPADSERAEQAVAVILDMVAPAFDAAAARPLEHHHHHH